MIRKAQMSDIPSIKSLIDANLDTLLPRTEEELAAMLDQFWVAEDGGMVVGCACLEVYSPKISELRTLAVDARCRGRGYGARLVDAVVTEARERGVRQILVVTSNPEFFKRMNFGACLNEKYALFWDGK